MKAFFIIWFSPQMFCVSIIWEEINKHHIDTENNILLALLVKPELKIPTSEPSWIHNSISLSFSPWGPLPTSDRSLLLPSP